MATSLGSASSFWYHAYNGSAVKINRGQTVEFTLAAQVIETVEINKVPIIQTTVTPGLKFAGVAMSDIPVATIGAVAFMGPVMALVDNTVLAGEQVGMDFALDVLTDIVASAAPAIGAAYSTITVSPAVGVALEAGPASGNALRLIFLWPISALYVGNGGV